MLLEIKTKTKRVVDNISKTYSETYLVNKEVFAEAELAVMGYLNNATGVESYEIQSVKLSPIKELYHIEEGENTYITILTDTFTDDRGNVKTIRYKVLLWADSLAEANQKTQEFIREGYDLGVESITAKQITYIQ